MVDERAARIGVSDDKQLDAIALTLHSKPYRLLSDAEASAVWDDIEATATQMADGACLTCLSAGTVRFPIDPAYHQAVTGHWPALDESATCPWAPGKEGQQP